MHRLSTVHGKKCSLVTRKKLGYSALKLEQLEVITTFVGGRKVFAIVSRGWVREIHYLIKFIVLLTCENKQDTIVMHWKPRRLSLQGLIQKKI